MISASAIQCHPIEFVEKLIAANRTQDLVFTYSRYQVAPPGEQAAAPRSPIFRVPAERVTHDWLEQQLSELSPKEELAWHSFVEFSGKPFHIPMIDFQGALQDDVIGGFETWLTNEIDQQFVLFRTGRSLHGYSLNLIPEYTWPTYLGRLLLLNGHDLPPIIDTRWVGHSLVRGFSALRWSHNTARYLAIPCLTNSRRHLAHI